MSRTLLPLAGFEVTLNGRFWVTAEAQFLAEAEKAKPEIDPIDGAGIEKMVNGLYEIEPAVVSRVKQIVEAK